MDPDNIETNIFRFRLRPDVKKFDHASFCKYLKEQHKILMNPGFQNEAIRIVTHRDVNRHQLEQIVKVFKKSL